MTSTEPIAAAAELELVLAHVNGEHADALLLIAQVLGGRESAVEAGAVGVDRLGLELVATDAAGEHASRVEFPEPIDDLRGLHKQALALVTQARTQSGRPGTTNLEREAAELSAIKTFITAVSAVQQVTPKVRRISFSGGDLERFAPLAPDQFMYVLLPPPGNAALTIDSSFTWEAYERMPEAERPVGAYYTVRAWRPATHEIDLDFVLHTPSGPASEWAAGAQVGDPAALWGPRTSFEPPAGTDRYVLFADDTGLPALSCILDSLPAGTPVRAVIEVADDDERQTLRDDPAFDVRWSTRDGAAAGTTTALLDAARALEPTGGTPYVWGGGESKTLTAVRKHLRQEMGLPREAVSLVGYWRLGEITADELDE